MSLSRVIAVEKWTRLTRSGPTGIYLYRARDTLKRTKKNVDFNVSVPPLSRNQDLLLITQHGGSDWRGLRTEQGDGVQKGGTHEWESRMAVDWDWNWEGADLLEEWTRVEFLNDVALFEMFAALSRTGNSQQRSLSKNQAAKKSM